jgi:AraC-like DNA-binding protein
MDHTDPFCIIGIKFKVGALYALGQAKLLFSLDKIQAGGIAKLLPMQDIQHERLLNNAELHPRDTVEILDNFLLYWISQNKEDRHSELTRKVLPLLDTSPISEIGEALHCSQRTVERSFLKVTHFTLKQCKSMNQLEKILNYLYKIDGDEINWPDLAYKFGFSDQPHLIRYIKGTIGDTPTNYASKRDLTIDTYGDFDVS